MIQASPQKKGTAFLLFWRAFCPFDLWNKEGSHEVQSHVLVGVVVTRANGAINVEVIEVERRRDVVKLVQTDSEPLSSNGVHTHV